MEIRFDNIQFNGSLYPGSDPSWSRLPPGLEADAAWEVFEKMRSFVITKQDIVRLGKDPEIAAKYPNDYWGLGNDAYIGQLDVFHQIHCLNELRSMAFADYGMEIPIKKPHKALWWIHLRHCTDMLLQNIMCHADADIITYQWMDTQKFPFPDFSINRKCRNFHDLLRWRDEHAVSREKYEGMRKPDGVKQVPAEREYYEMFGFDDSDLFPGGVGYPSTSRHLKV